MRLTTLRAGVSSPYTNLQNLSYTYDAVGNVASIVDGVNSSQRQCFGFDALDRLTNDFTGNSDCTAYTTGGTGPYNHTYGYDAVGNLTNYAGNTYTYGDSSHKHAVTAAYGNSYGYDGNGNQTSRTIGGVAYIFTFDYENRLTEVKQDTTTLATFLYDADGNRVKGTVSGTTTVYIAGIYERQGAAYTSYYEGGGLRRSGYTTNNGVFYMLSDHLKSTSALVARNGVLNVKYFYYPYGARRGVPFNTITAKHFTGQYHETALPGGEGLSYYGARWYDPRFGRFLSADTIVPNASNPQDLNRFAYVRNNPVRYIDPTGHYEFEESPDDPYFLPARSGVMPARRSKAPYSYTTTERRQLILQRGRGYQQTTAISSLEKFARLTEYAATLYSPPDIDAYMLDMSYVILGWSAPRRMWNVPPREQRGSDWLGFNAFPEWSGWATEFIDQEVAGVDGNNQMYHFWFYGAVRYFDGPRIAALGNTLHETAIPRRILGIDTGPLGNDGEGVSTEDFHLGEAGIEFAGYLARANAMANGLTQTPFSPPNYFYPAQIGEWLRINLGDTP